MSRRFNRFLVAVFLPVLVVCSFPFVPSHCDAQVGRSGLISPIMARRYGLHRSWYTQVELDRSRARVAYVTMHVSSTKFTTIKQVVYEGGTLTYSERDSDEFGDLLGKDGATRKAETHVMKFREAGIKANVETIEIPAVTLYVQTDRGSLHSIDGETGRKLWSVIIGNPDHPTLKPGASDEHVAVVNGSNLFVLSALDGSEQWQKRLGGAPGAGPAVNENRVFCPLVTGRMETYHLNNVRRQPWRYQSSGRAMIQPVVSPKTVSWSTDRGTFYVAFANRDIVRYRLQALDAITAHSTFMPNRLFMASRDGNVYAMHEYSGDLEWRFTSGEPISHPPVVVGDAVFVVTEAAGMYRLTADTGEEQWWTPQVARFVSASKDKIYCISDSGDLLIIDQRTGGRIGSIPAQGLDLDFINWRTDRLYLGTKFGVIQCLHDVEQEWPLVHVAGEAMEEEGPPEVQRGVDEVAADAPDDGGDPFGAAAEEDPFGGAAEEDPFGGGGGGAADDDPFGGGGGAADDDPFGGGGADDGGGGAADDDPFG
jgi:outer membrane protein assembly factor BamB